MAVKPIPEGYHNITANLEVSDAAAAIDFYKNVFGAQELCRMPGPDGTWIMHAELQIGDSRLFVNDFPPDRKEAHEGKGSPACSLHLYVEDADAIFKRAVEAGAKVLYPLENAFWGDRYGRIADPFGHEWGIATHIEDPTPEEISERVKRMFGGGI